MDNGKAAARKYEGAAKVDVLTARYVGVNTDGTVRVDFGTGPVSVYSAGVYTPLPGAFVRVVRVDTVTLMVGPVAPMSPYGRVTATGSPNLTVQLPDSTKVQVPRVLTYGTPAVNDDVLIDWSAGGIIVGKVSGVPVSDYLPPVAQGPSGQFMVDFRATDSGSQPGSGASGSGTWSTDQVYASDNMLGAWTYGSAIADSIPDNARITSCEIFMQQVGGAGGYAPLIGVHSLPSKSGVLTVGDPVAIPGGTGWKPLPLAVADVLKTGAAFGLGFRHGGYWIFSARSADPSSGLLRIGWSV